MVFSTAQKMKFPADLVTFTQEILNGKLHFLCSAEFGGIFIDFNHDKKRDVSCIPKLHFSLSI